MIMSDMAQTLVRDVFGDPLEEILTMPPYLKGIKFRAPGEEDLTLEHRMPFAWRKDFDYWMNDNMFYNWKGTMSVFQLQKYRVLLYQMLQLLQGPS